jgi:hypothetical protein
LGLLVAGREPLVPSNDFNNCYVDSDLT